MTINLSKAIEMVSDERDAAATVAQRKTLNTAANMLKRAQAGKPVFKSQVRWIPAWLIWEAGEFDLRLARIAASIALD